MSQYYLDEKKEPFEKLLRKDLFHLGTLNEVIGTSIFMFRNEVPMLRMGCGLEDIDIGIVGGEEVDGEKEPCTIAVRDHRFGDFYTYGSWNSIEELEAWLDNPTDLYRPKMH